MMAYWTLLWSLSTMLTVYAMAHIQPSLVSLAITRHHNGDLFVAQGTTCYKDLCVGLSSGSAGPIDLGECGCQCMPNLPIFRDDLNICVDDIHECTLAPFVSGTTTQKIPFVFLPLKGQIVYPSAEIMFSDVSSPICVVSGAQFLARGGWVDLRNTTDTEPPFRLFRDEGRTYLQWLGEGDLRSAMEGRLILVHLMCKDASESQQHKILTPCVAFRVAGNPSVREVTFSTDVRSTEEPPGGLSISEYVAIGVCSILLGLIYVASILLYLHIRKRRQKNREKDAESAHLTVGEEGVVKNNPLLQPGRRHLSGGQDNAGYSSDSGSCCSDSDVPSDLGALDDDIENNQQNLQISVMVHPCDIEQQQSEPHLGQESPSFERLPEEDVSIVEEVEGREDRPETVRAMGGTIRRKLYFNPAYFELDLLKTPPPAAIEFLTKIREVIAVAKHKMSAKRFSPSLIGIPEEELNGRGEKHHSGIRSRASSVVSMKTTSEVVRKNSCPSCIDPEALNKESSNSNFNAAASGACCPSDTKQRIIRKWLEDVPVARNSEEVQKSTAPILKETKNNEEEPKTKNFISPRPSPPPPPIRNEIRRPSSKGPAPPRPPPPNPSKHFPQDVDTNKENKPNQKDMPNFTNMSFLTTFKGRNTPEVPPPIPKTNPGPLPNNALPVRPRVAPSPPPLPKDDPDSIPRVQGKDKVPPAVAKTLMDAVIKELEVQKKIDYKKPVIASKIVSLPLETPKAKITDVNEIETSTAQKTTHLEYESDSLERNQIMNGDSLHGKTNNEGFRLFEPIQVEEENDYDDQIDSCIDTCPDEPTENIPDVVQHKPLLQDDHDYEVILLNPELAAQVEEKELKIYNLPEILAKNEGYSLVSEVYVNDGYTYSSGESSPNSISQNIKETTKTTTEKAGRLTIQVKDSPDNYKNLPDEKDNFEPDTLDRKPGKLKIVGTITNWEDSANEKYSNQKFHDMDLECQHLNNRNQYLSNETYMDSLERPHILLKSNGSFRKTSLERHVDDLLKTLESPLAKDFSSLREIYEAKGKGHRRKAETTSLVGSATSDTDCMSTLSWSEDRRTKLLHRGIILHMGSGKRSRRKSSADANNYPDVVPPRPPKPPSLSNTPQRSGTTTPASRSYCPSPGNRSVSQSPNRSACTSPHPPRSVCSPLSRGCPTPPPPPPPRSTPPASPLPRATSPAPHSLRSKSSSPVPPPPSIQSSPPSRSANPSGCTSPLPRNICGTSPLGSPNRSICASPTPLPRSACTSPSPPPRPGSKPQDNSPPLPPRNLKPPLPPKNAKSTRQKKVGNSKDGSNLARRPLPPLPSRSYMDTLSSVSSRDLETLSTLSGASMDSLNSSDYEAFYTLPYDGHEGEIYDKAQEKFHRAQSDKLKPYKNVPLPKGHSENVFSTDEDIYNAINMASNFREKVKDLRQARGRRLEGGKKWRTAGISPHKPEDSGYLSTDSNESGLRAMRSMVTRIPERAETPSQGSETEESVCDGASESGAESTATDSFFFGNFRKPDRRSSFNQSFRLSDVEVNSDTERSNLPILVRH